MKTASPSHRVPDGARLALVLVAATLGACSRKQEAPAPPPQQALPTAVPTTMPPAPTPTPVPTPPPVWGEARWGMTKAEVLAAFPKQAQRLPGPVPFAQPQSGSLVKSGAGDVSIAAYEADGATFRVLFGFTADALDRVNLSALKPSAATCEDVEKGLTARHSAPTERTQTGSSLKGEEIVWKLPDQTIVLGCGGVKSLGFLTVTLDHLAAVAAASPAP